MLEIEERQYLYKEIRKLERLKSVTTNHIKRERIDKKLLKLYTRLEELVWKQDHQEKIPLPIDVVKED
jgi:hypothetical protein